MEVSREEGLKQNKVEEEEQLITDFSNMFKGKGFPKKMPKLSQKLPEAPPNWLLEIPSKLDITKEDLQQRRAMDQRRWMSVAKTLKPQWQVLAAVVSVWNYLYSQKGAGSLPALTTKAVASMLEKEGVRFEASWDQERSKIAFTTFDFLCRQFKVKGNAKVLFKPIEPCKVQNSQEYAQNILIKGLKNQSKGFILITTDKVVCPLGFQQTPLVPIDAYKKLAEINPEKLELWIMNGTIQRGAPSFLTKRWRHIKESLETAWPHYLDLDEPKKGQIRHPSATNENEWQKRGNFGCLLQFEKD